WPGVEDCRRKYTGHGSHAGQKLRSNLISARLVLAGNIYRHKKPVFGLKAAVRSQKTIKAADEQAGSHQEHEREGNFSCNQRGTQAPLAAASRLAALAFA